MIEPLFLVPYINTVEFREHLSDKVYLYSKSVGVRNRENKTFIHLKGTAMNPDKLQGREVCASSSNRNFKGRQGSPAGRTLLMSPAMVAAAALEGAVSDVRDVLGKGES